MDCSEDCKLKTNSKIPGRAPVQLLGLLEGRSWSWNSPPWAILLDVGFALEAVSCLPVTGIWKLSVSVSPEKKPLVEHYHVAVEEKEHVVINVIIAKLWFVARRFCCSSIPSMKADSCGQSSSCYLVSLPQICAWKQMFSAENMWSLIYRFECKVWQNWAAAQCWHLTVYIRKKKTLCFFPAVNSWAETEKPLYTYWSTEGHK